MATFGDYDAAKFRTVNNNPYLDGGLRNVGSPAINDLGLIKIEKTQPSWGVERTTSVTPQQRIENDAQVAYTAVETSLAPDGEKDKTYDEMFAPFITDETRKYMAGTLGNASQVMLGGFDPVLKLLS